MTREAGTSVAQHLPDRGIGAHRGGATTRPENTLAAFREAARLGAHMVELDVRASADGEVLVLHDARVDRTTTGRGRLSQLTSAAARSLDAGSWKGPSFAGERIPTLREVFDVLPRDLWINVQIKRGEPVVRPVSELIVAQDRLAQAFLACGNRDARTAHEVHPELLICNLVRQASRERYVEHAIRTGANFVQFHWLRGRPEPELVASARSAGLRVNHFCRGDVDAAGIDAVFDAGVDFALVDDVPLALAVASRRGIRPRGSADPRGGVE